jgi:glycosyltransferase involved in cell wall biosynthesis
MSHDPGDRYAFLLAWPFEQLGGVNGVLKNLLREFQAAGDFVPLAIEVSAQQDGEVAGSKSPWTTIQLRQISSWNPERPWRSLLGFCVKAPSLLWRLRTLCRKYSIRVLNPHFIGLEYLPLLFLRKLGLFRGKLILSFHGADIREMMQSHGLETFLSKMLLRGADVLVPCSDGLREELLMFVPDCAARTVVVHNGIDAPAFAALATEPFVLPEAFRQRKIILNIGAFEYKKAHDILLRAFAIVKQSHPEAALVIAGQRSSAAVAQLGVELGIQDDLLLFESIPHAQIVALLKRSDMFVLSSRWQKGICGEGFAMALLEAAAVEKPVISTLSCGTTELIRDGENGRLVPTDDPEALAHAMVDFLNNPEDAARMARVLHEDVDRRFTWKDAYNKYVRLAQSDTLHG